MTGEPTFFEMGVADTARARTFYSSLFDWQLEPVPSAGSYRISTPTIPGGMHGDDEEAQDPAAHCVEVCRRRRIEAQSS